MVRAGLQVASGLVVALMVSGCGGGGYSDSYTAPTPTPAAADTIHVGQSNDGYDTAANVFNPTNLTVAAGTTVNFVWKSDGHTVDSGTGCTADGTFSSGGVRPAGYQKGFAVPVGATPGTVYHFLCQTHCSTPMACTITVK